MKDSLYLHIPSPQELWYRQKLMEDPKTMDYNKGYNLNIDGYNSSTGCIAFPKEKWADWYSYFIGNETQRFYAYIAREPGGSFIGEVNLHKSEDDWYDMGIVLEGQHRGRGYSLDALKLLLQYAFEKLGAKAVRNGFEEDRTAAVRTHLAAGFKVYRQENGIIELIITLEDYFRLKAIKTMTASIADILADNAPSIYLYGSCCMDDFRPGWSDIDILVLTKKKISHGQTERLLMLRQELSRNATAESAASNSPYSTDCSYYRLFEGGMLTLDSFLSKTPDCVVYWGTTGQKIIDSYPTDSFMLAEIIKSGRLLYGDDIRSRFLYPTYKDFYTDIKRHYEAIRKYAKVTNRSFYSFGWLLDIARGIYTLRTGNITSKTKAAEWALEKGLCPVQQSLETALKIRKDPLAYLNNTQIFDYAERLGADVQRFADVLEKELK